MRKHISNKKMAYNSFKMVHNAAKDNKEKEKEATIVQLQVKIKDLEDIGRKLQHQVHTKMEVKQTPKTSDPQPLVAITNIFEVVETKEIS